MNINLFDTIQARQSVRAFLPREIEPEKLNALLLAASQAPSAGNLQAYEIHLIRDAASKQALVAAALDQRFLAQAPVVLLYAANATRGAKYGERGAQLYCVQDATIAAAYTQLAATALGLATCWVGAFDDAQMARAAQLPAGQRPVALLPVGYAAETPRRTPRRKLEELVHPHGS